MYLSALLDLFRSDANRTPSIANASTCSLARKSPCPLRVNDFSPVNASTVDSLCFGFDCDSPCLLGDRVSCPQYADDFTRVGFPCPLVPVKFPCPLVALRFPPKVPLAEVGFLCDPDPGPGSGRVEVLCARRAARHLRTSGRKEARRAARRRARACVQKVAALGRSRSSQAISAPLLPCTLLGCPLLGCACTLLG